MHLVMHRKWGYPQDFLSPLRKRGGFILIEMFRHLTAVLHLIPHVIVLERNSEISVLANLYDRLQVVYFFSGDPYHVIIDRSLDLHTGVFNEFDDLFCIFLCKAIPYFDLLLPCFATLRPLFGCVKGFGSNALFMSTADQYIDQLPHLHI